MPRSKDPIWNNFDAEPNPAHKIPWAKCKLCDWRHVGIPDRMKAHSEKHKNVDAEQSTSKKRGSVLKSVKDSDVVATSTSYKNELDSQIAKYFYGTNTPFIHAEHPEFKKLINKIRPGYKPPTPYQIAGKLLEEAHVALLTESKIKFNGKTVTMALDGWSNLHNEPIVGISIVDSDGNYALTNSIDTSGNAHTSDYLLTLAEAEIERCEDEFQVRVGCFVTDNTGNVAKMRRMLTDNMEIIQHCCNSHILNLLSGDLQIPHVESHVMKIIKYFRNTHLPSAWYKQFGGKKLIMPSTVRWNTIHGSINSFLKNRGIIIQVCQEYANEVDDTISRLANDRNLANNCQEYQKRMHPIAVALDRSQRDNTTIAIAVEIWHKLQNDMKDQPKEVLELLQKRKAMALNANHFLANMIDHRFRGVRMSESEKSAALELLNKINPAFLPIVLSHTAAAEPFPSYWYAESLRETSPITWWKTVNLNQNCPFPWVELKADWIQLCEQFLSSAASTAGLERIFSTFGFVHSKLRNRLGNTKAAKLAFIYKNLNHSKQPKQSSLKFVWGDENEEIEPGVGVEDYESEPDQEMETISLDDEDD